MAVYQSEAAGRKEYTCPLVITHFYIFTHAHTQPTFLHKDTDMMQEKCLLFVHTDGMGEVCLWDVKAG